MSDKFCPVCKNKNASDAVSCAYCGVPFGSSSLSPVTTVPMDAIQPELILKRTEHLQHMAEYPKDTLVFYVMDQDQPLFVPRARTMVLGRVITSAVPGFVDLTPYGAADLGVSRQHAQISYSGTYAISDTGSTNGTWLNQARLTAHKPYLLHSGDEVRLGTLRLTVYYHQDEATGGSPEDVILLTETPNHSGQRPRLTMVYWTDVIQPYLAALVQLQDVINPFQEPETPDVTINTISAMRPDLPIGISLGGASQAILLVKNFVNPWRSDSAADLDAYLTGHPATPAQGASPAADTTPLAVTMVLPPSDANQAARQAAMENLRAKLPGLAEAVAEHLAVLLAMDRTGLADKLLPPLRVLATSHLQMVLDKAKPEA
jgi:predicted component of type VI protein secretion system